MHGVELLICSEHYGCNFGAEAIGDQRKPKLQIAIRVQAVEGLAVVAQVWHHRP